MISGRSVTGKFAAGNRRLPRYSLLGVSGWWSLRVEYKNPKSGGHNLLDPLRPDLKMSAQN